MSRKVAFGTRGVHPPFALAGTSRVTRSEGVSLLSMESLRMATEP